MTDESHIHTSGSEVREGILDHQVEDCPKCGSSLEQSFGLAGGGFGAYGYCPSCERVVWKCVFDE